MYIIPL